mgnify:CR=1 FL=1
MFGFGKQKSLHLLFLQTVAASHSSRVNFQKIWNSHRHVADIQAINRVDKVLDIRKYTKNMDDDDY